MPEIQQYRFGTRHTPSGEQAMDDNIVDLESAARRRHTRAPAVKDNAHRRQATRSVRPMRMLNYAVDLLRISGIFGDRAALSDTDLFEHVGPEDEYDTVTDYERLILIKELILSLDSDKARRCLRQATAKAFEVGR